MIATRRRPVRAVVARFSIAVVLLLLAASLSAAQQATKIPRIGVLSHFSGPNADIDAFRQGLRELGWAEGQNIAVDYRWTAGREDQIPALAAEFVRLKVDVLVTSSTRAAQAAKRATTAIPIVATFVADPVGSGLVASLAHPGGNITGLSTLAADLVAKRLELLKEMVPGVERMAVLWDPGAFGERTTRNMMDLTEVAGRALGVKVQFVEARQAADLERTFSAIVAARVGALMVFPSPMFFEARRDIVKHAANNRVPAVYPWREGPETGGLMSYAPNLRDMYHRTATYVDKILKGTKPADLPVEQPTRAELVINLRTARALGVSVPQSFLLRADQVLQ